MSAPLSKRRSGVAGPALVRGLDSSYLAASRRAAPTVR